jgi:hypothetical protein
VAGQRPPLERPPQLNVVPHPAFHEDQAVEHGAHLHRRPHVGAELDPAWRAGRDLYADVWMVGRQAWFAGEMVRRFGSHPAVAGWLVSNEMPLYGGDHAPPETVAAWAQIMRDAVRAAGGRQPFSLGDGAWGIEATGRENGFRLADAARLCDFLGPHVYPVGDDRIRQHYAAAWQCELAGTFGRPVVLEEFGVSSDFASEANAVRYYRHVLHNSLLAGATGWIAWNNTDFDLPGQDPYRHHAGACVYVSYSPGDSRSHPGPWYGRLNEMFGVRHRLDVGMDDPVEDDVVRFTLRRDFGGLAAGTTLRFAAAGNPGFLPVEPDSAEVLATDARGRPALLRRTGRGSLILCTYPVERMAALTPRVNPDDTVTLYNALARHAGVRRPVTVADPRVACDTLIRDDGALFAVLASHAAEALAVTPVLDGGELTTLHGEKTTGDVRFDPFGIKVLRIAGHGPPGPRARASGTR